MKTKIAKTRFWARFPINPTGEHQGAEGAVLAHLGQQFAQPQLQGPAQRIHAGAVLEDDEGDLAVVAAVAVVAVAFHVDGRTGIHGGLLWVGMESQARGRCRGRCRPGRPESKAQVRPSTRTPDQKESYQITRPLMAGRWPSDRELPGFRQTMLGFESQCWQLGMKILSCFALKLGFPESFFTTAHDPQRDTYQSTLRMQSIRS
ncbi:hypothetical protein [Staphylococcus aureus]|uniref:hypothetical protein n=1 Tax=Staphylococcus aureus TaxID=1280 RepID=UPI001C12BE1B|nr:hypothetical protein [Staphylococcus aureus]